MIGKAFFEQLIPPPLPPYTVPERHKDVLLVKTFVKFTSLLPSFLFFDKIKIFSLKVFFNILKLNYKKYPFYWRMIAKEQIKKTYQLNFDSEKEMEMMLVLNALGPAPDNLDKAKYCKYRVPFWFVLICSSNDKVNQWASKSNIDLSSRPSNQSFLNIAVLRRDIKMLRWGVEEGLDVNDIDQNGNPLLVLAMQASNPNNDSLIIALEELGADWDFKGSSSLSANNYLLNHKDWQSWNVKRNLKKSIVNNNKRKTRKI